MTGFQAHWEGGHGPVRSGKLQWTGSYSGIYESTNVMWTTDVDYWTLCRGRRLFGISPLTQKEYFRNCKSTKVSISYNTVVFHEGSHTNSILFEYLDRTATILLEAI